MHQWKCELVVDQVQRNEASIRAGGFSHGCRYTTCCFFVATRNSNIDKRSYRAVAISSTCYRDGRTGSFHLHVIDDSIHPKERTKKSVWTEKGDNYCSLVKERPWAEHLTSLPKRGGWVLFWVFHINCNHERVSCHVYSDSMTPKQIIGQIL